MYYDLSQVDEYSFPQNPMCFVPKDSDSITIFLGTFQDDGYGNISMVPSNVSYDAVIYNNVVLPSSDKMPALSTPSYCYSLYTLKHDEWIEVGFPIISFAFIVFILSMIYHIIFKRLMP